MPCVVVVDRHPVEPGAEVLLHLPHQPAGEPLQLVVLGGVLGRDDEAELMAVALAALEERPAVGAIGLGVVERAGQSLAGDAVTLDVAEMELRRPPALPLPRHDPTLPGYPAAPHGGGGAPGSGP